jgi:hypothetical protein
VEEKQRAEMETRLEEIHQKKLKMKAEAEAGLALPRVSD